MRRPITRRLFLEGLTAAGAAALAPTALPAAPREDEPAKSPSDSKATSPIVIASANGWHGKPDQQRESAVEKTYEMLVDPELAENRFRLLEAVVEGVSVVENDPNDHSVGLGGLPNEEGVVQLDSSVMFGPTHQAGAVAAIENIQNPARAAMYVLRYTDHSLIAGEGAYRFARAFGMEHAELLTERAREIWLYWRQVRSGIDDWMTPPDEEVDEGIRGRYTHGTIHLSALDSEGNLAAVTTTSGLSFKIPGRVGDSPIVGAGMYCDNDVGSAGATGRGEEAIVNCGSFSVVEGMRNGLGPTEACLAVLKRVSDNARKRGLFENGKPNFQLSFYALRKDGTFGAASMLEGAKFAVRDGDSKVGRHQTSGWLYEK